VGADAVDTGIVCSFEAYQKIVMALPGQSREHIVQGSGCELAGAASRFYLLGQTGFAHFDRMRHAS
jgi:hypothetical protein